MPASTIRLYFLLFLVQLIAPYRASTAAPRTIYPDTLSTSSSRMSIAPAMQPRRKTIGLALSGGGANGMAQIGVLKALEEEGIAADIIAGTSIGAIIGGLYSAGYSAAQLEALALELPWDELLSLDSGDRRKNFFLEQRKIRDRATIAIRFDGFKLKLPRSLSSAQNLTRTLDLLCINAPYHPRRSFDDLPVSFRAVSTDLVSGERVTIDRGSLSLAMLASSTVPVLFEPVEIGDRKLADGGLVANLAVDELEHAGAEYKIAVDTRGSMYTVADDIDVPWKAADQAMTILIRLQYPEQLKQADAVIAPDVGHNTALDFSDIPGLIEAGYRSGRTLARKIRNETTIPARGTTPLEGYSTSLAIRGLPAGMQGPAAEAGSIIRNAATAEEALKALLETDSFTSVHAVENPETGLMRFVAAIPPIFERVEVDGPENGPSRAAVDSCFAPITGRPYRNRDGSDALEALTALYRRNGMSLVSPGDIHVSDRTLRITMTDGRPGPLLITRNRGITSPELIEREIGFDSTSALSLADVRRTINNLDGTGAFNRVSIGVNADGQNTGGRSPLLVNLDEKSPSVLRLGLRYDQTYKAQALVDFRNENVNGTMNSIGGWAKISEHNNRLNLEYYIPRIGSTSLTFMTELYYEHVKRNLRTLRFYDSFFPGDRNDTEIAPERYTVQRYGLSSAFGARIGRNGHLLFDATLQNARTMTDEISPRHEEDNNNIATAGVEFTLDNRDNSYLPTSGRYIHIHYSLAPSFLNRRTFWTFEAEHEENIAINDETTAQLNLRVGLNDPGTPFSEMFFAGGSGSPYSFGFAGLKENDLAGHNILLGKASLRYSPDFDLIFPSSFQLSYHLGETWEDALSSDALIHGIGAGITWETPLGPAQFSATKAFRFDGNADSYLRFAESVFYFSLGHEF
ncbi:BamA/TamA family outer membrane protein [Prosthecochloris sp. ZM_2]|uniref:patatin-like phospholipase family protein n=1 Tax=Prosthecochloris sp. ZM_2 TaxID=2045206 RepID=UPI001F2E7FC8|nr:BamA/TamA family outer membrane protein [Prosthecochloris sp. ZM_2]